jgi:hypothetical protein
MTFESTKSRPSTNSHSTKINDDKSLWAHFPCRILLCYLPTETQIFSPHKTLLAIFPAKFSYVISCKTPNLLSLSLSLSLSLRMNLSNPKPQKQHPPTRKAWESPQILATKLHLFSSSQLPTKRKPSNRSNQDRQKKTGKKKREEGERGPDGGRATERKEKQKPEKRN